MKKVLITTTLICSAATAVYGQEISYGGMMANFGRAQIDDFDANYTAFGGEVGLNVDAMDFWISGIQVKISPDDDGRGRDNNTKASLLTLGAGASLGNGFRIDASSSDLTFGSGLRSVSLGIDEIGVAYDTGTYFGRLSYADLDVDTDGDVNGIYGLHVGYAFSDAANVSLSVHAVNGDADEVIDPVVILTGEYEVDRWGVDMAAVSTKLDGESASLISLGGTYNITNEWSVYGAYSLVDISALLDDNVDILRIGGAYTMNDRYKIFADYTYADTDRLPDNYNGVSIGISMDFGDKPASYETTADRLTNVMTSALMLDY